MWDVCVMVVVVVCVWGGGAAAAAYIASEQQPHEALRKGLSAIHGCRQFLLGAPRPRCS